MLSSRSKLGALKMISVQHHLIWWWGDILECYLDISIFISILQIKISKPKRNLPMNNKKQISFNLDSEIYEVLIKLKPADVSMTAYLKHLIKMSLMHFPEYLDY
jgi:hypothetical protein